MNLPGCVALAASMLVMSCAGSRVIPQEPASNVPSQLEQLTQAMHNAERELDQVLLATDQPDCTKICALENNVCNLASRICQISERNPERSELGQRCQDAIQRCERARVRVSGSCQCGEPT